MRRGLQTPSRPQDVQRPCSLQESASGQLEAGNHSQGLPGGSFSSGEEGDTTRITETGGAWVGEAPDS